MRSRIIHRLPAAGLTALLVLSACGDGDGVTEPSPDSTVTPMSAPDTAGPTDEGTITSPTGALDEAVEAVPEGQELLLRDASGDVQVVHTLDPEGESFFVAAAARPGSTARDATIVTVTRAEGTYDLRWLEISEGEPGDLRLFEQPYRPATDMAPVDDVGPNVAWAPGGDFVAWIEWGADGGTTLRTVGWDEGPGTGDEATDNAAFGVEPVPAGSRIESWTAAGDDRFEIEVLSPGAGAWTITVERQADGALALPPDAVERG